MTFDEFPTYDGSKDEIPESFKTKGQAVCYVSYQKLLRIWTFRDTLKGIWKN